MRTFDEEIARRLQEAARSGELESAAGYGKPMADDRAWDDTPPALRMSMKILKDAGATPPEVEMFHERVRLKRMIGAATDDGERGRLRARLIELEQNIAVRLEMLRVSARL